MVVNIVSSEFKARSHAFYAQLRAESPVHPVTLPDKRRAWLISRYDDVVTIMKDERFVKDKFNAMSPEQVAKQPQVPAMFRALERNMLDIDDPDHARLRNLVHKAFTPRLIGQMQTRIQDLTHQFLDRVAYQGQMDLIHDYALPLPTTVIAEMLGVNEGDRLKFNRWSRVIVAAQNSTWAGLKALPNIFFFMNFVKKLVKERRANPQDDLVSALIQAEEAGEQMSEDELIAMIFLLLVAGHETTVNLIGNGMLTLLNHPEQLQELQANPSLIRTAVEELLRYDGPLETATERYASTDIEFQGVLIPRGELVLAAVASANRDESQFVHAETVNLQRDPNRHLAFGTGIHYCLGSALARLEGQIAINTLLERMPDLHLRVASSQLKWKGGLVLRGLERFPVRFARQRVSA